MRAVRMAAVLAALALLGSCIPPPSHWGRLRPVHRLTLIVVDPCRLTFEDGSDAAQIGLSRGLMVKWQNHSKTAVVVRFSDYSLFGQWSVFMNPGETRTTTVRSAWAPAQETTHPIHLICGGVDGPTPPVKEEPPPMP